MYDNLLVSDCQTKTDQTRPDQSSQTRQKSPKQNDKISGIIVNSIGIVLIIPLSTKKVNEVFVRRWCKLLALPSLTNTRDQTETQTIRRTYHVHPLQQNRKHPAIRGEDDGRNEQLETAQNEMGMNSQGDDQNVFYVVEMLRLSRII